MKPTTRFLILCIGLVINVFVASYFMNAGQYTAGLICYVVGIGLVVISNVSGGASWRSFWMVTLVTGIAAGAYYLIIHADYRLIVASAILGAASLLIMLWNLDGHTSK
jgi:hypothetical protein